MDYILEQVKEKGVVSIIKDYKKDLDYIEKERRLRFNVMRELKFRTIKRKYPRKKMFYHYKRSDNYFEPNILYYRTGMIMEQNYNLKPILDNDWKNIYCKKYIHY